MPPNNTPIQPPLLAAELAVCEELRRHVAFLAGEIGVRHDGRPASIQASIAYIARCFDDLGLSVQFQRYPTERGDATNLIAELPGRSKPDRIVIIGAHYDTVSTTPGADDNASAVAGLLAIASLLRGRQFARTLRLVAFANEEPPHFAGPTMGSRVYARSCRSRGDQISAMVCLEMIGYYDTSPGSQQLPTAIPALLGHILPKRGDFIAFVSDVPTSRRPACCAASPRASSLPCASP